MRSRALNPAAPGRVALVGAGPGDPELLTLKAVRAIGAADWLLVDDLVDERVLAHAKAGARVVHVGKRGGCRSTPQRFIERLMIRLARRGHAVVRLKGGDPLVFGRGGEELATLRAAGIRAEVVPGVTAGIAAPASLGIPVTHRGLARGAVFVTGHAADGREPEWQRLAGCGLTLVIYMGLARLATISAALRAGGLPDETPAAIVAAATLAAERAVVTTLGALAGAASGIGGPAIVVIGEVVRLAELVPAAAHLADAA